MARLERIEFKGDKVFVMDFIPCSEGYGSFKIYDLLEFIWS